MKQGAPDEDSDLEMAPFSDSDEEKDGEGEGDEDEDVEYPEGAMFEEEDQEGGAEAPMEEQSELELVPKEGTLPSAHILRLFCYLQRAPFLPVTRTTRIESTNSTSNLRKKRRRLIREKTKEKARRFKWKNRLLQAAGKERRIGSESKRIAGKSGSETSRNNDFSCQAFQHVLY